MLIALKEVSRTYDSGERVVNALRNVTLGLPQGEFIAVVWGKRKREIHFLKFGEWH